MMKSERKDGGPAFPRQATPGTNNHVGGSGVWTSADPGHPGMSLRDYFAAQSVGALIRETGLHNVVQDEYLSALALNAYAIADALLKARSDPETSQ